MLRYTLERVRTGSVLATSVYDGRGNLLVKEGTTLTPGHLGLLRRRGVRTVLVEHPDFTDLVLHDPISAGLLLEALRTYAELGTRVSEAGSGWRSSLQWNRFAQMARLLVDEVCEDCNRYGLLHAVTREQRFAVHSLNVAIAAVNLAREMFPRDKLVDVGLGALLHDVGRLAGSKPEDIPSPLEPPSEEERQHPLRSLELIRGARILSAFAKVVVLQHHERRDGSGFPHGSREEDIHPLAQVVGLADAYVSVVEAEGGLTPDQAVEWIMSMAGQEFDHRLVASFLKGVDPYPLGVEVKLSSGEEGIVIRQTGVKTRPVVRVVRRDGQPVAKCYDVDLITLDRQTTVIQCARPLVSI